MKIKLLEYLEKRFKYRTRTYSKEQDEGYQTCMQDLKEYLKILEAKKKTT